VILDLVLRELLEHKELMDLLLPGWVDGLIPYHMVKMM
jgi:hypothetical protein